MRSHITEGQFHASICYPDETLLKQFIVSNTETRTSKDIYSRGDLSTLHPEMIFYCFHSPGPVHAGVLCSHFLPVCFCFSGEICSIELWAYTALSYILCALDSSLSCPAVSLDWNIANHIKGMWKWVERVWESCSQVKVRGESLNCWCFTMLAL